MSERSNVWSNGSYTIEQVDFDHVRVTKQGTGCIFQALICGGDLETALATVFIGAKVHIEHEARP